MGILGLRKVQWFALVTQLVVGQALELWLSDPGAIALYRWAGGVPWGRNILAIKGPKPKITRPG